jgi:hypothetical protein
MRDHLSDYEKKGVHELRIKYGICKCIFQNAHFPYRVKG